MGFENSHLAKNAYGVKARMDGRAIGIEQGAVQGYKGEIRVI